MKRIIIPAAVLLAFIGLGAAAAQGEGPTSDLATSPTPSATPSPSPSPSPSETPETFTMPILVGANLQDAQDSLQALGSYVLDQQDASGDGRLQINDSNWKVCSQVPASGEEVPLETIVVLASVKNDESCPGAADAETTTPAETTAPAKTTAPAETKAPSMTVSQEQAVRTAKQYLDYSAFSRTGLIGQLEYEGFSTGDSTFAVDQLDTNWNEQAAVMAQQYLDYSGFSRSGLIDQLVYEGFTQAQAEYGVNAVGL